VLSVVIPVWNGGQMLEKAVSETLAFLDHLEDEGELIIVSDGCNDSPEELIGSWLKSDSRLRLIQLDRHRGKGAAVRSGVLAAQGELIAMLDVDLSAAPDSLITLREAMGPNDSIVCGSRTLKGSILPKPQGWLRRCAGFLFHLFVRMMTSLEIKDTQCGCKLFRAHDVQPIFESMKVEGFAFDVELLFLARKNCLKMIEVPIEWSDSSGTTVNLLRDGLRMAWTILTLKRLHR